MALEDDLLELAHHLATRDPRRPKQASLRRATSTVYYAFFNFLLAETAKRLRFPRATAAYMVRSITHQKLKKRCNEVVHGRLPGPLGRMIDQAQQQADRRILCQLIGIAELFLESQEKRHEADYDTEARFSRNDVLDLIRRVERAFENWQNIRNHRIASIFLASLFAADR